MNQNNYCISLTQVSCFSLEKPIYAYISITPELILFILADSLNFVYLFKVQHTFPSQLQVQNKIQLKNKINKCGILNDLMDNQVIVILEENCQLKFLNVNGKILVKGGVLDFKILDNFQVLALVYSESEQNPKEQDCGKYYQLKLVKLRAHFLLEEWNLIQECTHTINTQNYQFLSSKTIDKNAKILSNLHIVYNGHLINPNNIQQSHCLKVQPTNHSYTYQIYQHTKLLFSSNLPTPTLNLIKYQSNKLYHKFSNILNNKIISSNFIRKGLILTLCECQKKLKIYLHTENLQLWDQFTVQEIEEPFYVCCQNIKQNSFVYILDQATMKLWQIDPFALPSSLKDFAKQEKQSHANIQKTLTVRIDFLGLLNNYLKNDDVPSAFRFVGSRQNFSLLNDGLKVLKKYCMKQQFKFTFHYLSLLQKLFDSKYQSHLQTVLILLVQLSQQLIKQTKMNEKEWKECISILKQIKNSKKMKKISEQEKKLKLFQLSYQFIHQINSIR